MRQVLFAGEEPQERPALFGDVVADCPPEHGIGSFERVKDRAHRDLTGDLDLHLGADARQSPQMSLEAPL